MYYKPCKLVLFGDGGEPVGVGGGVEVATALTVAFNERSGPEVSQTRSGRDQRLSRSFSSSVSMLEGQIQGSFISDVTLKRFQSNKYDFVKYFTK